MKCLTRVKSNVYAPTSTDLISQNMIYWQMSKHYKRIKSAKKVVDTSAPLHCKFPNASVTHRKKGNAACQSPLISGCSSKLGLHCSPQAVNESSGLICNDEYRPYSITVRKQQAEKQVSDIRHKRTAKNYKHHCQNTINQHCGIKCCHNSTIQSSVSAKMPDRSNLTLYKKGRNSYDIMEVHSKDFVSPNKPFNPRILKTDAEPRIRNLRVYYPPRKKLDSKRVFSDVKDSDSIQNNEEQCEVADHISTQTSAYSADSDSQRNWNENQEVQFLPNYNLSKGKGKVASELSSCDSAYNGGISSGGESRGSTPEQNHTDPINMDMAADTVKGVPGFNEKNDEMNDTYLKFTNEIVDTIIKNNILSNSGIKNIVKLCMSEYEGKLDKVKMIQEVKKLLAQLDVEDEEQHELTFLQNNEPFINSQNYINVNNTEPNFTKNQTINTCTMHTEICDPFDDDLLLQEYRSELRKVNSNSANFMFPSSGGVELAVEYMCAYPLTENVTSQDLLEEELWLHPFNIDLSLGVGSKNSKMQSGTEVNESDHLGCFSRTLHASDDKMEDCDTSNISSNASSNNGASSLPQHNPGFHSQHTELLSESQPLHEVPLNGHSECSQISYLSEMISECKLTDT